MPFEPAFMQDLDAFRRALAEVRDAAGWTAFKRRWFADQPWPRREGSARPEPGGRAASATSVAARVPGERVVLAGRTFVRASLPDDLSDAARYEYFAALQAGFAAVFPDPGDARGGGAAGTRSHCPACELWSDDPGGPACPSCGRTLLRMRVDPPTRR